MSLCGNSSRDVQSLPGGMWITGQDVGSYRSNFPIVVFLCSFFSGYGAVGLDSNPSYGHTPSHHTPQLSSLSFKHEDTLSPPNNIGSRPYPEVFFH